MNLRKIQEGKIKLSIPISKNLEFGSVFYNPDSELSRDISVVALKVFQKQFKKKLTVCDAHAATGVRGLRYAKEVPNIKKVVLIDKNPIAVKLIKKNIKENKLQKKCFAVKGDANIILRQNVYNVIDLDPFGSPNVFLDSTGRSIFHKGFLIVSATDTGPLCGSFPNACFRKYGIKSFKTEFYNELGLRILISYIILTLAKYDRCFIPVLMHSTKHYFRVFGKIEHAGKLDKILKQFEFLTKEGQTCGPIYTGKILDKKFCKGVLKEIQKRKFRFKKEEEKLLKLLIEEAGMPPFYYDLHYIAKKYKTKIPRIGDLIKKLKSEGFKASRTHFCLTAIKTNATLKKLLKILT